MTYFAKCEPTTDAFKSLVSSVVRASEDVASTFVGVWIQTDYNTYGNVHYAPSPPAEPMTPDGLPPLRANFAGIGYTYDKTNDVFYAPQPFPSWTLNTSTWLWEAPTPMPTDGEKYYWDETIKNWVKI